MIDPTQSDPEVTILSLTQPKANRYHTCGICAKAIVPGQSHYRVVYDDAEGGFLSRRFHMGCVPELEFPILKE